jgi:ubiquinone/menaquinone biosynthesis C-methylase UbiE
MSGAISAFNRAANGYDEWYDTTKGKQVFDAERAIIEKLIPKKGVGIEIGAGTGVFAEALTGNDRFVLCLDLSSEMLAHAKSRGLECILGNADKMPLRLDSMWFAYMITVLEFLAQPIETLTEASKVTNKEAPIVTLLVNKDSMWGALYSDMAASGDLIFSHAQLYTLTEFLTIAHKAGLSSQKELGTLTTAPTSPDAGDEVVKPSVATGVIAVKLVKRCT